MAQTLEQLRTSLAWGVSRMFAGTATGGTTTTLIDTAGLLRFTETDTLQGAFLYIRTTTDGLAPQGESRRIQSYDVAAQTITVDRAFTLTVHALDTYEIYLAPLTLGQWDQCVNDAIRNAWPDLFSPATEDVTPTGALTYALSAAADRAIDAEITFGTALAGYPSQGILQWYATGVPGALTLKLSRPVPTSANMTIRVLTGQRFDELAAGESTDLDEQYILDAGKARFYQRMAGASRQSDRGSFLQLMAHWQEKAEERRQELAGALTGLQQQAPGEEE